MDIKETGLPSARRHPWEVAKARAITRILRPLLGGSKEPVRTLDVGCGDGFIAQNVFGPEGAFRGIVDGVDTSLTMERLASMAPLPGFRYHSTFDDIAGKRFELVLALDVLEHQEDDAEFLAEIFSQWLSPGGMALFTVPAFNSLFSDHDRFLGHYRRYSLGELEGALGHVSCRIIAKGYLFSSLLPVRAISLTTERIIGRERGLDTQKGIGSWRGGPLASSLIAGALDIDNAALLWLAGRGIFPPGLSAWALCEKPR